MLDNILTVGIPTLAVLTGILINNSPLTDLRSEMRAQIAELRAHFDARLNDTKETLRAEFRRVEEVIDARLKHLGEREH